MTLDLKIINPLNHPSWDDLLLSNQEYSFFHSSNWAKVLSESYHYKPFYFVLTNEGKLLVAIPLMEVKSILTGKRGVSLPFTDYCVPLVSQDVCSKDVFNYLIEYGKQAGWKFIEIRGGKEFFQDVSPASYYCGHTLSLSQNKEKIFASFRSSTRRNIKKAIKEGVKVKIYNSLLSMKEFYRLNCMTRKEHGLPPQPYLFFYKIYDHIISKNNGFIILASYKKKIITGAMFFHFGKKALYKYGASDKSYHYLRANNLVLWEAIKWYLQREYESFNFGKTEVNNKGLLQFKNGWGAREGIINYYKYDLINNTFIKEDSLVFGFHNRIFRNMPMPLLKIIGRLFYKHMG